MGLRSSEQMEIIKFLQRLGFIEISLKHNNHDLSGEERNDKKVSIRERLLHIALIKYQQMEQQQENLLESENNDLSTNEKRIYLSNAVGLYFILSGENIRNHIPFIKNGRFVGSFQFLISGSYQIEFTVDGVSISTPRFDITCLESSISSISSIAEPESKLSFEETLVANILLNWTSDSQNPDTVAGLKAIQAPERTESAGATIGQSLHQGLQFSIQEYQVRGSSDIYEGIPRWYKDEGRKDESNLVLLVSIRDLQGSKLRVSQTLNIMVRGCYEDGTRALSTDHRDVFELNEKRSRLSITPEVDFAIVCGRFTDVSKRHMRRPFCVHISAINSPYHILPTTSPPLYVASKRCHGTIQQDTSSNIRNTNYSVLKSPNIDLGPYFSSPTLSSLSQKTNLTAREWLCIVLQVVEEITWNENHLDQKTNKRYPIAPGNPNRIIDELLSLCPISDDPNLCHEIEESQKVP